MLDLHCRIIWHQDPADNSHTSNFKAPGKPRNSQFWKEEKSMGGHVIKYRRGYGICFFFGGGWHEYFWLVFMGGYQKISANVTEGTCIRG